MNRKYVNKKNQQIGIQIQERIAVLLESYIPNYKIFSNGTRGADLYIMDNNGFCLEGEVKTAKEFFPHIWYNKKRRKIIKSIRRGAFNILPEQLNHDFFVFVVRFVDILNTDRCIWNGDIEVFYAKGKDVKDYLEQQTLNCMNYKLCIDKLPLLNVKEDFLEVFNELKNESEKKV